MPSGGRPGRSGEPPTGLRAIARVLVEHEVRFILIGGYAAIVHGSPVLTRDIDVCYARDGANLERLTNALRELHASLRGAPPDLPFQLDALTLKAGDHFTFATDLGSLDCLGTPAGTAGFPDLDQNAVEFDVEGIMIRVASVEDLMRMKRAAGRTKDLIALEWLAALRDEIERDPS
jgi:Nucleotidyl transferase AbiEii toxin, Type IV TA system